jgi:hypothetical protein
MKKQKLMIEDRFQQKQKCEERILLLRLKSEMST